MSNSYITVLSHSGGAQSQAIVEMVLRGDIERPLRFVVINADPGMEDSRTHAITRETKRLCEAAGIDYLMAQGPNLWRDIVNMISNGATRMDNPPFWTRDKDGKRGKLKQGCTQHYKIAPMRACLRKYLAQKHNISHGQLRAGLVEQWIGFAYDEWHRCSESDVDYIQNSYPLIERKMDREHIVGYYLERGIAIPPRSVCSGCFANGLDYFASMYRERPDDWDMAVDVDNAVEHWKPRGITEEEVFVSASLIRLRDMPAINFGVKNEDLSEHHCNSGVCFV